MIQKFFNSKINSITSAAIIVAAASVASRFLGIFRDRILASEFGAGNVLVARKPFKVYAWVSRGYYRVGDVIRANFSARTLDGRPARAGDFRGQPVLLTFFTTW